MHSPIENLDETPLDDDAPREPLPVDPDAEPDATSDYDPDKPKKRNCGHTGPTSPEGRAKSAQNARKHGACARTLILPNESPLGWELLLARWTESYAPTEDSLEADFLLRTAQSEWQRLRAQRCYNDFLKTTTGSPMYAWPPAQLKMHELLLRYKNSSERAFHRELRALESYYKSHNLTKGEPPAPQEIPELVVTRISCEELRQKLQAERDGKPWTPIIPTSPPS